MAHGEVHYLRLTGDPVKAKSFYYAMFNWKFGVPIQIGGKTYYPWDDGEGPGGDAVLPSAGEAVDWLPFVEVADLDESINHALGLGATVLVPATKWIDNQRYAILKDPCGARIGIWEP